MSIFRLPFCHPCITICFGFLISVQQQSSLAADVLKEYAAAKQDLMNACDEIDKVLKDNDTLVVDINNKLSEIHQIERDYALARQQKKNAAALSDLAKRYSQAHIELNALHVLYNRAINSARTNLLALPRLDQPQFKPLLDKDTDKAWSDRFLKVIKDMTAPSQETGPRMAKFFEESTKESKRRKIDLATASEEAVDQVIEEGSRKMLEAYYIFQLKSNSGSVPKKTKR